MDISKVLSTQVKLSDTFDFPAIPAGKSWIIDRVGATDSSKSAAPSSFILSIGSGTNFDVIRHLCVTTGTVQLEMKKEFTGDGVKHLRVVRQSIENKLKDMPFWLDGYER